MKFAIFLEYFFSGLCALAVLLILRFIFGKRLSGTGRFFLVAYVLYLSALYNVVGMPGLPYLYWGPNVSLVPFSDFQDSLRHECTADGAFGLPIAHDLAEISEFR